MLNAPPGAPPSSSGAPQSPPGSTNESGRAPPAVAHASGRPRANPRGPMSRMIRSSLGPGLRVGGAGGHRPAKPGVFTQVPPLVCYALGECRDPSLPTRSRHASGRAGGSVGRRLSAAPAKSASPAGLDAPPLSGGGWLAPVGYLRRARGWSGSSAAFALGRPAFAPPGGPRADAPGRRCGRELDEPCLHPAGSPRSPPPAALARSD